MPSNRKLNDFLFKYFFIFSILLWPMYLSVNGSLHLRLNEFFYLTSAFILLASNQQLHPKTKKLFLLAVPAILFHFLLTNSFFCEKYQLKGMISMPFFLAMIFVGYELGQRSDDENWSSLGKTSLVIITLSIIFIICEIIFPDFSPNKLLTE
jgi:hypothetical protein